MNRFTYSRDDRTAAEHKAVHT